MSQREQVEFIYYSLACYKEQDYDEVRLYKLSKFFLQRFYDYAKKVVQGSQIPHELAEMTYSSAQLLNLIEDDTYKFKNFRVTLDEDNKFHYHNVQTLRRTLPEIMSVLDDKYTVGAVVDGLEVDMYDY